MMYTTTTKASERKRSTRMAGRAFTSSSSSAASSSCSPSSSNNNNIGSILALVACLAVALLAPGLGSRQLMVECAEEQLMVESRQNNNNDLSDTIKYLEKLDTYFSQIARPRFGRSDPLRQASLRYGQPLIGLGVGGGAADSPSTAARFDASTTGGAGSSSLMDLVSARLARNYREAIF